MPAPAHLHRLVYPTVVLALGLVTTGRAASPRDRRFFSARYGVGVEAPQGWTLSQHTGYPSILVLLLHPDGGRISISAALTTVQEAGALAQQNRHGLEAQKLTVTRQAQGPRGGVLVDARASDRDEIVRQLYLVRPIGNPERQAVVITLVTRAEHLATAVSAFDWTVGHLVLEMPAGHEEPVPDGGVRESSSAGQRTPDKDRR